MFSVEILRKRPMYWNNIVLAVIVIVIFVVQNISLWCIPISLMYSEISVKPN